MAALLGGTVLTPLREFCASERLDPIERRLVRLFLEYAAIVPPREFGALCRKVIVEIKSCRLFLGPNWPLVFREALHERRLVSKCPLRHGAGGEGDRYYHREAR